jgi:hypothetical protein
MRTLNTSILRTSDLRHDIVMSSDVSPMWSDLLSITDTTLRIVS